MQLELPETLEKLPRGQFAKETSPPGHFVPRGQRWQGFACSSLKKPGSQETKCLRKTRLAYCCDV